MKDRKRLQPIDAYDSSGDQATIYANIVPDKQSKPGGMSANSEHTQQPVIYAELAATAPPVVTADSSAWFMELFLYVCVRMFFCLT